MKYLFHVAAVSALIMIQSCGSRSDVPGTPVSRIDSDTSVVIFGPSLVEVMFAIGEGGRISGVDRYSVWPPEAETLPKVGGYLDASFEQIAGLSPTSIHSVGNNPDLREIAHRLGVVYYSYSFDTLGDVFAVLDTLEAAYGADAVRFRADLTGTLDSLKTCLEQEGYSVLLIIYHSPGSGTMTTVGRNTFLCDLVEAIGCHLAAPGTGTYPSVSVEGVLDLMPDHIICLYPDTPDTLRTSVAEEELWTEFGFDPEQIHILFDDHLLIPGARMGLTAERIAGCML